MVLGNQFSRVLKKFCNSNYGLPDEGDGSKKIQLRSVSFLSATCGRIIQTLLG
jgi:hypothetical protein